MFCNYFYSVSGLNFNYIKINMIIIIPKNVQFCFTVILQFYFFLSDRTLDDDRINVILRYLIFYKKIYTG